MYVDPAVVRVKYDREFKRLEGQRSTLESRGIFVLSSSEYPYIDVQFVPQHPLRVGIPANQISFLGQPQTTFAFAELTNLSARSFKARFNLQDFDLRAPSLEFFDPWTNRLLDYPTMFRALEFEQSRKAHLVLLDDHPTTHRPFLCLRGIREYHEHPQHSGDEWLLYRDKMSLFSIILSVWRVSLDLIHPQLMVSANSLQTLWTAEEKA